MAQKNSPQPVLEKIALVSVPELLRYMNSDPWMDKAEAAQYVRHSVRSLEEHMSEIPHHNPTGGKVLFLKSDLDRWIKNKSKSHANGNGRAQRPAGELKTIVRRAARRVR